MSTVHRVGLLLLVVLAFVLGNTFAGAQSGKPVTEKWEYRLERNQTVNGLNAVGGEGWELVTSYIHDDGVEHVFKRLKR